MLKVDTPRLIHYQSTYFAGLKYAKFKYVGLLIAANVNKASLRLVFSHLILITSLASRLANLREVSLPVHDIAVRQVFLIFTAHKLPD